MAAETETAEARATLRYLRSSPQKVRRVVDLLRGKPVTEALSILKFSTHMVARPLSKLLHSAIANAEQAEVGDLEELVVSQATVDGGPSLKRIRPAPMGRAYRYVHRTSHVTFHVKPMAHVARGKGRPAAKGKGAAAAATSERSKSKPKAKAEAKSK